MQPKIYSIDEHQIPAKKIDRHAYYVIHKLKQKGYSAYLVGGSVRDLLLGIKPKDFDISTSAKPEEVKAIFKKNCLLIGRRFRLAHVRFGRKILEVSTFRTGDLEDSALIVRDNDYGTEEEDVLRRDFTINGLFYDPDGQTVIDYVGGYLDLEKKILRTIGQPEVRFQQDPVRMIRLAKFQARFAFDVDPAAIDALGKCKEEIIKSSQARILEELFRMLESGASKPFFAHLQEYGLLELLLPKLSKQLKGKRNKVYPLLEVVDEKIKKNSSLDRSILVSCLIYPLLEKKVEKKNQESMHLGKITEDAHICIDEIFHPFFRLSRKMRSSIMSVLTSQFRISSPLTKRRKIPKDPNFPLALRFFEIRTLLYPDLTEYYEKWKKAWEKKAHLIPSKPQKRRARGKNRTTKNQRNK